jgi:3HB-oligomer hydrolase (3HBOH)/Tannase and feruloyl esterase
MRVSLVQVGLSAAFVTWSASSGAALTCADIEHFLSDKAVGVNCSKLDDLRATDPLSAPVTPPNSPTAGSVTYADGTPVPAGAISATTDPTVISIAPTPTVAKVPGIQVSGWYVEDPRQARFLLRLPETWNGKLVVAGASGTRSEFNGDWAWSNFVLSKGYAYASQNKGVLNLFISASTDPLACRLNPASLVYVHFYDNDPGKEFTQWTQYMLKTADLARRAVKVAYNRAPRRTYAVGTSNGGYQVRRAIEEAPDLFDGGVDWEGTFVSPYGPNVLIDLPPALANFPAYEASGYDENSDAAKAIRAAGYPPDIKQTVMVGGVPTVDTLWKRNNTSFWEVTMCQWQKRLDPTYPTYGTPGLAGYNYQARTAVSNVFANVEAFQTTGKIKKPLVTVAGTMDALLPINRQARAYEAAVNASRKGNNDKRNAQYRLYEVQNGTHIESYAAVYQPAVGLPGFKPIVLIQPHAQRAFDLLVDHVESNVPLPPSQCIPLNGAISTDPSQPGHCSTLLVPVP